MLSLLDQPFVKDVWLQLAMPPNTQDASFATELRFSLSWETSEDVFERLQYAKVGPDVDVLDRRTRQDQQSDGKQSDDLGHGHEGIVGHDPRGEYHEHQVPRQVSGSAFYAQQTVWEPQALMEGITLYHQGQGSADLANFWPEDYQMPDIDTVVNDADYTPQDKKTSRHLNMDTKSSSADPPAVAEFSWLRLGA
ncbi:hypothetical protein LTR60_002308 [Cryomyces antarcticus]|nr:hypothetical protein LTR60_002308 [Cryomyces antarcticus]